MPKTATAAQERWRAILADWHASGLSGAEYCRRNNLRYSNFRNWTKRLKFLDRIEQNTDAPRARKRINQAAIEARRKQAVEARARRERVVEFAEAQVVETLRQPGEEPADVEPLRILFAGGATIEVTSNTSLDLLGSVIALLGRT